MRVRIELANHFVVDRDEETHNVKIRTAPGAEITLSDPAEKLSRSHAAGEDVIKRRKYDVIWAGDSFPDILRNIAAWIEAKDDPSLRQFVEEAKAKRARRNDPQHV